MTGGIMTLNRTILELKSRKENCGRDRYTPLNRTILELKYALKTAYDGAVTPLNRTILELKYVLDVKLKPQCDLSIAPFWN